MRLHSCAFAKRLAVAGVSALQSPPSFWLFPKGRCRRETDEDNGGWWWWFGGCGGSV
ncbi:hypothetical protein HanRHA438_Chr07g0318661 [Helianthus annuus]|nr:hypothetical protein HanHA89_Chr07g0272071 [Helianthus annuus]KAJ0909177.1 hypothetical protein HanRHA438_Chr07g0318661 [Helianthus annuus]